MSDFLWQALGPTGIKALHAARPLVPRPRVDGVSLDLAPRARVKRGPMPSGARARARAFPGAVAKGASEFRDEGFRRPRTLRPESLPESLFGRAGLSSLYRVTRNQLSPVFFYPGSLESRALRFLSEPDPERSNRKLQRIGAGLLTKAHESLYRSLSSASEGRARRHLTWSRDPCADALRIRYLMSRPTASGVSEMAWYGALRWAGNRALDRNDLADVPEGARRCLALAVASAAGYRRAVELLPHWFPDGPPKEPVPRRWSALLVMRAAIEEKRFVPETVPYLVPSVTTKLRLRECVPVTAALRCAVRERHEGGTVFLLAAIMTMAFRCSLARAADGYGFAVDLPAWGQGALSPEQVSVLSRRLPLLANRGWSPWRDPVAKRFQESLGIDLEGIDRLLIALLHDATPPSSWFLYLDDALLKAALFLLLGKTVSARLHLGGGYPASTALNDRARIPDASRAGAEALWLLLEQSTQNRRDTVEDLLRTPDPNVILGTPIWAIENGLGKMAPLALQDGRMKGLSAVRALLQRGELRDRLAPYWILRKREVAGVIRGLLWVSSKNAYPSEEQWLEFLERLSEEALAEC